MTITLREAFNRLGAALQLDPAALEAFAAEDDYGGYHPDANQQRFPAGSTWAVEGKILYALVRAMRPEHVVEIGTFHGAGATHILGALTRNEHGRLTCIDIAGCGDMIPSELLGRCTKLLGRGQDLLPSLEPAQLIFEDASHTPEDVAEILGVVRSLATPPRVILSHDAEHFAIGHQVREGYRRVFGSDFSTMLVEPSDCGLAYRVM